MINNYNDFCRELMSAGFSVFGGNDEGVFGIVNFGWQCEPPGSPVRWHTGDPETDPWEWRVRVLTERDDVAYGKVFFRKGGFITKEWYPYFLAARNRKPFDELYAAGLASRHAKQIIGILSENEGLPVHEIKRLAAIGKEDKSRFDKAMIDLQMGLYITVCGTEQKRNKFGEGYGWHNTCFCLTERFWDESVFEQAAQIGREEAAEAITRQVFRLNPRADKKKIVRFIG
jgi:hypothetical protein